MDIVERLRDRISPNVGLSMPPTYFKDPLCQEAADEIERLREALRKVAEFDLYGDYSNAYEIPEIARAALKETE